MSGSAPPVMKTLRCRNPSVIVNLLLCGEFVILRREDAEGPPAETRGSFASLRGCEKILSEAKDQPRRRAAGCLRVVPEETLSRHLG